MATVNELLGEMQSNFSSLSEMYEAILLYLNSGTGPLPDCLESLSEILTYDALLSHANLNSEEMSLRYGAVSDLVYFVSSLLREQTMLAYNKHDLYESRINELSYEQDNLDARLGVNLNYIRGTSSIQDSFTN